MAIQLTRDLDNLLDLVTEGEKHRFLECVGIPFQPAFRFNPLKHTLPFQNDLLSQPGFTFEAATTQPNVFRVSHEPFPVGKSLSHFLGHIYIQNLSSMLPTLALSPKPGEWILDMCAAPGSKTSHIAALMQNQGVLVANDVVSRRISSLIFNLRRMGVTNTAVLKGFGERLGNQYFETFDRILLDPPCSALGTAQKSPEVLSRWTPRQSRHLANIQKALLQSGLKALKPGGCLVYSTCTVTPDENEEVLAYALEHFPVELEPLDFSGCQARHGFTRLGSHVFPTEIRKAMRLYPFEGHCEGFFIARLRKTESFGQRKPKQLPDRTPQLRSLDDEAVAPCLEFLIRQFRFDKKLLESYRFRVASDLSITGATTSEFPLFEAAVAIGLPLAHLRGEFPKLTTEGSHLIGGHARKQVVELGDSSDLERYVNRDPLPSPLPASHQILVTHCGFPMGHALSDQGRILSRFPRAGWRFELG
jgi:16S rRNA (cytosine1407-C5)-methyltransferase